MTLDQYFDYVYESMAEVEEDINNLQAHVFVTILIQDGFELKRLNILGVPNLH